MTSRFTQLVIDCHDPHRLAALWCAVLDYQVIDERADLVEIGSWEPTAEAVRAAPAAANGGLREGTGRQIVKNRLHPDVSPIDGSRDEEVQRPVALRARRVDVGQGERNWVVLADPEGNEFCVLRTLAPQSGS